MDNRSIEEILSEMLNQISNTEDKSENSFIHDALSPAAIEMFGINRQIEDVYGKFDVENLEGGELDRFVHSRTGIRRRQPTHATTSVIISGKGGTDVEAGTLVSAGEITFATDEDCALDDNGLCEVNVTAERAGSVGNVPARSIKEFPVSVTGLLKVDNPEPVINGEDRETDDALRKRYYNKLQRPGKAGNAYHYKEWANEVAGVGGAKVFPLWDGALTVKVLVIGSDMLPANDDLITEVADHIETRKPFGAYLTVDAPSKLHVNINVNVVSDEGISEEELKENIRQSITEHLAGIALSGNYVSYARIGNVILNTPGVIDYSSLKLNDKSENIVIDEKELAVVGKLTIR